MYSNQQKHPLIDTIYLFLERELNGRAVKYNHFELKNIAFDESKFPMLCSSCLVLLNSSSKRRIGTAALINFFVPNAALILGRPLIGEGGGRLFK